MKSQEIVSSNIPTIQIFAHRISRKCFLEKLCYDDTHPVLATEKELVMMAQSKLCEFLLKSFSDYELKRMWPTLKHLILEEACNWAFAHGANDIDEISERIRSEISLLLPLSVIH